MDKHVIGKLKVWWIPQIPCNPFYVEVASLQEGVKVMEILANYDLFQLEHNIRPDYSNVGGIEMLDEDGKWCSWYDDETGLDDPVEFLETLDNATPN